MTRVVLNRAFKAEVQREPEFIGQMKALAIHVVTTVRQTAREVGAEKTGYYVRHVKALPTHETGEAYIIAATDPFGHLVEAGSVNNPPYAPLQIGARAAGLRLVEDPKK